MTTPDEQRRRLEREARYDEALAALLVCLRERHARDERVALIGLSHGGNLAVCGRCGLVFYAHPAALVPVADIPGRVNLPEPSIGRLISIQFGEDVGVSLIRAPGARIILESGTETPVGGTIRVSGGNGTASFRCLWRELTRAAYMRPATGEWVWRVETLSAGSTDQQGVRFEIVQE